jgi:hypothetical protein
MIPAYQPPAKPADVQTSSMVYWPNDIPGYSEDIDPSTMEIDEATGEPIEGTGSIFGAIPGKFNGAPLAAAMRKRIETFANHLLVTGKADRMRRSACLVYGIDPDSARRSTDITFAGDQGNVIQLRSNMYRRLAEATHVLVTGSRPSWKASVSSSDSQATDGIEIADELLDHALTRLAGEDAATRAAWFAYVFSEGHMSVRWNELTGDAMDATPDGRIVRQGDVIMQAHRCDEVVRDVTLGDQSQNDWLILRTMMNRWDLAELYPAYRREILTSSRRDALDDIRESLVYGVSDMDMGEKTDQVTVYELFHRASPSVPKGRYAMMVGDTIVSVGPNKYADLPVYSMIPDKEPAQPFGYSSGWDLMAMQQALDSTLTSVVSTTENLGQPGLWGGVGGDVGVDMIKGFAWLRSSAKPEPVQYVTPQSLEVLTSAISMIVEFMTQNSGLNAVALGDAGKSASGDALAMMHSLAIQSTSRLQAAYAAMFADAMLGVIRRYRTFVSEERLVSITGKGARMRVRRWTGASLASIDAIKIEMRAAIMRTATGRQQVADKWLTAGLVTSAEQYMQVATTGSLAPITERPLQERSLIERENEDMLDGKPVILSAVHNHALHIMEHSVLLLDPDVLANPALAQVVEQHIIEHTQQWGMISMAQPDLLAALGQNPAPSAMMAQAAAQQAAQAAQQQPPGSDKQPKPEPAPPNVPAKLEESNVPPGGGMDAGANDALTGGPQTRAGAEEPVMA